MELWALCRPALVGTPKDNGAPLSWDNVIYNSPALGYVEPDREISALARDAKKWIPVLRENPAPILE